jgi:hypothetical protein
VPQLRTPIEQDGSLSGRLGFRGLSLRESRCDSVGRFVKHGSGPEAGLLPAPGRTATNPGRGSLGLIESFALADCSLSACHRAAGEVSGGV